MGYAFLVPYMMSRKTHHLLLSDQFCSLIFTMSNLYFVGCVYSRGIDENWRQCTAGPGPRWGYTFLLAQLPLLVRLVQSVKRYADSGLVTHLINVCPFDAALQPTIELTIGHRVASTVPALSRIFSIICGVHKVSLLPWLSSAGLTDVVGCRRRPRADVYLLDCLHYTLFPLCWIMGVSIRSALDE